MTNNWKDFKILNLRGDEIPSADPNAEKTFKHPNKKQFLRWTVNVKNANVAMGTGWLMLMAAALPFHDGTFDQLCHADLPDDFDTFQFGYCVLDFVVDHGGLHSLPYPVEWWGNDVIVANYKYVINSIAMFNAQMSIRCIDAFPEIYGRVDAVQHPLTGSHNWIMMQRTFMHQTVVGDDDAGWAAIMKHVATVFKPTSASIKMWMEKMDEKVLTLIKAEVLIQKPSIQSSLGLFWGNFGNSRS